MGYPGPSAHRGRYGNIPSLTSPAPSGTVLTSWFNMYGPRIRSTSLQNKQFILTFDPGTISSIMTNVEALDYTAPSRKLSEHMVGPHTIIGEAGDNHRRLRRIMLPALGPSHP